VADLLPRLGVRGLEAQGVEAQVSGSRALLHLVKLTKGLHSEDGQDDLHGGKGTLGQDLLQGLEGLVA